MLAAARRLDKAIKPPQPHVIALVAPGAQVSLLRITGNRSWRLSQALEPLVLRMFSRLAPRGCLWRKEERTGTLDFGCDESRDLPDMRGSSVIFVNVHVIGQ